MSKYKRKNNKIYSDYDLFDLVDDNEWWAEEVELGCANEDDDRWEHAYSTLEYYLECEQANLNINVGNTIIQIADLGLWDGRHHAYKEEKSQNIADLLVRTCEYCEWWCDAHDLRGKMSHHDGTNYILYRRRKDGITDYQWDNFLHKLYMGTATREHISKYTSSLLPYVAKVYGWKYHGKDVA